jgi:hypothetical protein
LVLGAICMLWIIGVFAMLPVIPFIEANYFLEGSDGPLDIGFNVTHTSTELTRIEIPSYYPNNNQCLDFWFESANGKHLLTVNNFTMTLKNKNNSEIKRMNSFLFWDEGSEDEKFSIKEYEIERTDSYDTDKYVFFRTAFDLSDEGSFTMYVKADYLLDGIQRDLDRSFKVVKKKKLRWSEFRVH